MTTRHARAPMGRVTATAFTVLFLAGACFSAGGAQTRTVLVDFRHDEFAGAFTDFFPKNIHVRPGDSIVFRQTWTGEPHSVTMGTRVDALGKQIEKDGYFEKFEKGGWEALPPEPPKDIMKLEDGIPWMVDDNGRTAQNGAQPCFLRRGLPPRKSSTPCTKAQQRQPSFDGTYSFYSSGFIPYQGDNGNTYTLKIAQNAKPGRHFFYCNYHGEFMSGWVHIEPKSVKIPSQDTVNREASSRIQKVAAPLVRTFRLASRGRYEPPKEARSALGDLGLLRRSGGKSYFKGWLAGLGVPSVSNASINEFIPNRVHARVGQELTWVMLGFHTISFNVPKYFPIIEVRKDGTVRRNPKLDPPAGGAPKPPSEGEHDQAKGPRKPTVIDAGSWDGRGFRSSGTMAGDPFLVYHLRITRPGTYRFACLIHPPMVGTLVVTRGT